MQLTLQRTFQLTLKHVAPLNAAHSPAHTLKTHRSPERSSLSRSQSPEFWSPVPTPICHYNTLFSSVLHTPSLWCIVCFVTQFYIWSAGFPRNLLLPCMIAFACLTNDAFYLFPACTLAYRISCCQPIAWSPGQPCLYCCLFGPPVYDHLPAPGPSYVPPPEVLYNKHLLRSALETSPLSHIVFITDVFLLLLVGLNFTR